MASMSVDGMRVEAVHEAIAKAAEHCRAGKGTIFTRHTERIDTRAIQ